MQRSSGERKQEEQAATTHAPWLARRPRGTPEARLPAVNCMAVVKDGSRESFSAMSSGRCLFSGSIFSRKTLFQGWQQGRRWTAHCRVGTGGRGRQQRWRLRGGRARAPRPGTLLRLPGTGEAAVAAEGAPDARRVGT